MRRGNPRWHVGRLIAPSRSTAARRCDRRAKRRSQRRGCDLLASGLSPTYLEGALIALCVGPSRDRSWTKVAGSTPARSRIHRCRRRQGEAHAILDPFSVYEKGEELLRKELHALSAWHRQHHLGAPLERTASPVLNQLPQAALIDLIVAEARAHAFAR